jgi:ubiquinone/menaquinone biosynthesis C-methylase UbiE
VGPVTNYCSNHQSIPVDYRSLEEMQNFARQNNNSNPQGWEERLRLVAYCLLLRGKAVARVGLLDERFSPGNYEDDDYSFRLLQAGYRLMLCHDTFLHHFGSATFKGNPAQYAALLKENGKKFEHKWGFNSNYATLIRQEIVRLMDAPGPAGVNVLDIGCACGATLLYIKNLYGNAGLYGVEMNKSAAEIAGRFAGVAVGDVESLDLDYREGFFDYIICADLLEHLKDPWQVLKKLIRHLKPRGRLLVSFLNVMHHSVIRNLLQGLWSYQDGGMPGAGRLRLFTLGDIINMLGGAGYEVLDVGRISQQPSDEEEKLVKALADLAGSKFADQYVACQYIVRAGIKGKVE